MEPGTITCRLARADLLSMAGEQSMSWHFPGPTCLFCKQKLQRGLSHTGFLRPHWAAWVTHSLCSSLHCCCLRRYRALSWALPVSCQDVDAGFGVRAQRCSAGAFRGTISASAMWISTCAKAAVLLNCPCRYCFWHLKHCLQSSSWYARGGGGVENEKTRAKILANHPFSRCKLPCAKILPSLALRCQQRQCNIWVFPCYVLWHM